MANEAAKRLKKWSEERDERRGCVALDARDLCEAMVEALEEALAHKPGERLTAMRWADRLLPWVEQWVDTRLAEARKSFAHENFAEEIEAAVAAERERLLPYLKHSENCRDISECSCGLAAAIRKGEKP